MPCPIHAFGFATANIVQLRVTQKAALKYHRFLPRKRFRFPARVTGGPEDGIDIDWYSALIGRALIFH